MNMLKGLEHPCCEEKLSELGGFSARRQGHGGKNSSVCLNRGWEGMKTGKGDSCHGCPLPGQGRMEKPEKTCHFLRKV